MRLRNISHARSEFGSGSRSAFTLIEVLVVIAIIGILASLILPSLHHYLQKGRVIQARTDIARIVFAIENYHAQYGHLPTSDLSGADITYGGDALPGVSGASTNTHAEVMAILMNLEKDNFGNPTANNRYVRNPQRKVFLTAKASGAIGEPGVGPDLVFRDPWGRPYVITLDNDADGQCLDAFYRRRGVSQRSMGAGHYGLMNGSDAGGNGDHFGLPAKIMVWSLGPEGKADPRAAANAPPNRNHVRGWQ